MDTFKIDMKKNISRWISMGCLLGVMLLFLSQSTCYAQNEKKVKKEAYLFAYFSGNGDHHEAIRFALSEDGFHYTALNNGQPILDSKAISNSGGVRDPHILRGADGKTFYMVVTDMHVAKNGWTGNKGMVLLKSKDLIHWTHSTIVMAKAFPELNQGEDKINRVWAPQVIYDSQKDKYMVYWAMRLGDQPDKIYYAYANEDFTKLTTVPKQLFFSPTGVSCIDADIVKKDDKYHLFFKTESTRKKGIKSAVSTHLTHGYKIVNENYLQATDKAVEGSCVFKLNHSDTWVLMYDMYRNHKYQLTTSKDLIHFKAAQDVSMDFHARHGTVMGITKEEAQRLMKKWPPMHPYVVKDLAPNLVAVGKNHNPALKGLFADPEILYAQKTDSFYIYPTTDGFDGWSGYYFKTFASKDMVHWKDEGVILDLKDDVSWADQNAWAPCIIERKINGKYKYFYYFTAAGKIGVATSDHPTGPFKDSGKPLIDHHPKGIHGGQEIDLDVFKDPETGKYYLYWGNGYMAGAELNDDMTSIKTNTLQILTPASSYNEGTYVFYRNGKYYFMWSENDTRDPNYQVHYGIADSPLGEIHIPEEGNLVIAKDTTLGIYGTGHNSVIKVPGKDKWYIVYHRFEIPDGIKMGSAAGYHREVCIDKLEFTEDGKIKQVQPTLKGIRPIN